MSDLPPPIAAMKRQIEGAFPMVEVTVEAPLSRGGDWWIDLRARGHQTAFSWRADTGFAFYGDDEIAFGSHPRLVTQAPEEAFAEASGLARKMRPREPAGGRNEAKMQSSSPARVRTGSA